MQIVIGMVTDAILQKKPRPMLTDPPRLISALTKVLAGYLGTSGKPRAKGEAGGKDTMPVHDELTDEPSTRGAPSLRKGQLKSRQFHRPERTISLRTDD